MTDMSEEEIEKIIDKIRDSDVEILHTTQKFLIEKLLAKNGGMTGFAVMEHVTICCVMAHQVLYEIQQTNIAQVDKKIIDDLQILIEQLIAFRVKKIIQQNTQPTEETKNVIH